jgi:hypothetical protein
MSIKPFPHFLAEGSKVTPDGVRDERACARAAGARENGAITIDTTPPRDGPLG